MSPEPATDSNIIDSSGSARMTRFTRTYVPFALLLSFALLAAELSQNLDLHRTIYAIWATTVLLIPALCFFVFAEDSETARAYWLWLWTFSYLLFMVHFYWAVFIIFGSIHTTFAPRPEGQGRLIAGTNFFLTGWWTLDVVLAWTSWSRERWVRWERLGAHLFVFAIFGITLLRLRPNPVTKTLGLTMIVSVVVSLVLREWLRNRRTV